MSSETAQAAASPARSGWIVLAILAVALGLRLPGYAESVWIDELYTSNIFCGDPIILLKTLYSDIHPPVYFVFIHFWNQLFGDQEIWLRLPALLFGLGTIVLIWRLGELFIGRSAGLVAAGLLAVSPVHIWYSQEARPYSASLFLALTTILAYYRIQQGRKGWLWTSLFFFALVCLSFTHYYNATFPCLLLLLGILRKTPNRRRLLIINVLVLLMLALYMGAKMYFSEVPVRASYLRPFDHTEAWKLFFGWFLTGDAFGVGSLRSTFGGTAIQVMQVVAVLAFLRGSWRLLRNRSQGQDSTAKAPPGGDILLHMLVVPACLVVITLVVSEQAYIERSALPALPFFALVLGAGMTGFQSGRLQKVSIGLAGLAAAILLSAFYTRGDSWTVYKPNPDWRSAAAFLGEHLPSDGPRAVLYADYPSPTALTYYDPRMQEVKKFEHNDARIRKLIDRTTGIFGTEGFPGAMIQETIEVQLAAFAKLMKEAEQGTRLAIYELGPNDPLLDKTGADGTGPQTFWLLLHDAPGSRATRLLADERIRIESEKHFRSLTVYKLQRVR